MFKTSLTAAAFTLIAGLSNASPIPLNQAHFSATTVSLVEDAAQYEEVAYYCEWATVYDYYGNWITVWQCF